MSSNNRHAPFPVTRIAIMAVFSLLLMLGAAALLIFALFYNDLPGNVMKVQAGDLDIHATYVRIEGTKIDTDASSPYYGRFITFAEDKNKDRLPLRRPVLTVPERGIPCRLW